MTPPDILDFSVYPNPTDKMINIVIPHATFKSGKVTVYNSLGMRILSSDVKTERRLSIDMSAYPTGLYIVELKSENAVLHKRVVVSR